MSLQSLVQRVLGTCCVLGGLTSLLAGAATPLFAAPECGNGVLHQEQKCFPAMALDRHENLQVNMTCNHLPVVGCSPGQNSQCGTLHGYQVALKGECGITLFASERGDCYEDQVSTFIPLNYYTSECKLFMGVCGCVLTRDHTHPTQYSEVCDCSMY